MFLVSASRNQPNVRYLVIIIDRKIFYEHVANYFQKFVIKCFWAKETETILIFVNLFQLTRLNIFVNTSHTMSRKLESSVIGTTRPK